MDWNDWRREFPILERTTYLNSCSLGALSVRARERAETFRDEWDTRGASAWYDRWLARLDELRGRVAHLFGAAPSELALAPSISGALSVVASALDFRSRPRVVVTDLDFPTLAYQWMARPEVEVVRVPSDDGVTIDPRRIADAVDDRTALLATSHVFFTTGAIQDLAALADIAHVHGALFLVDAYQSAGQVPIDVRATDVDMLVAGPLKWLLGGPGLAYLYVREEMIPRLVPTTAGWFGTRDPFAFDITGFEFRDDARRYELGTPALPTVHTALGGQEIIDELGVDAIRARNTMLTERLVARAHDAGLRLRIAPESGARSAIVMIEDAGPEATVETLAERDIIVDARPGHVRVSPHFYNTQDEVDRVVDELAGVAAR